MTTELVNGPKHIFKHNFTLIEIENFVLITHNNKIIHHFKIEGDLTLSYAHDFTANLVKIEEKKVANETVKI